MSEHDSDSENEFAHADASAERKPTRSVLATFFFAEWDDYYENGYISWDETYNLTELAAQLTSHLSQSYTGVEVKFLEYCVEKCPSTDRIHVHMIISLSKPFRYARLRDCPAFSLYDSQHYKPIFNMEGAMKYVRKIYTKSGALTRIAGPFSYGSPPRQGERSDLTAAIACMEENEWKSKAVAEHYPEVFVKYHKGLDRLGAVRGSREPASKLENIICLYGPPGSGKSHYAMQINPDSTYSGAYVKYTNLYFDGFMNEEVLFMDEFNGSMLPFDTFKRWFTPGTDGRRVNLPMRDSIGVLGCSTVVFATNRNPVTWWDLDKSKSNPWELFRRFTKIVVFGGEYGDSDNPSWFTELESVADRKRFMQHCVAAKSGNWDHETAARFFTTAYHSNEYAVLLRDAVVPDMQGEPDAMGTSMGTRKRMREATDYNMAAPFLDM